LNDNQYQNYFADVFGLIFYGKLSFSGLIFYEKYQFSGLIFYVFLQKN